MVLSKPHRGKLIVIEGTDGSGKGTQLKLLLSRFKKPHRPVATLSFPQYGKKSTGPIEEYLNGTYGTKPTDVSPYVASLFYAIDRFDASVRIRTKLRAGTIVLIDRYVDSNAAHQGGKIKNPIERKKFLQWLYDIEYRIFNIPKPDIVIILHIPATMSQQLVAQKQKRTYLRKGTHDIHEADLQHLKDAEQSYLLLAKTYPNDHRVIECVEDDRLLTPQQIHEKIWNMIEKIINKKT